MTLRLRLFQLVVTLVVLMTAAGHLNELFHFRRTMDTEYQSQVEAARADGKDFPRQQYDWTGSHLIIDWSVAWLGLAAVLALTWGAASKPAARALALVMLANFYGATIFDGSPLDPLFNVIYNATLFVMCGALLRFAATFPIPLTRARLEEAARKAGTSPSAIQLALLHAKIVWPTFIVLGLSRSLPWRANVMFLVFTSATVLSTFIYAAKFLRASHRIGTAEQRRQILWIMNGLYLSVWAIILYFAVVWMMRHHSVPILESLLRVLPDVIMIGSLTAAVFYRGAIDPSIMIRQATLYGSLGVVLLFVYGGVENVAADVVSRRIGLSKGWATWMAGGVIAVAFGPLRQVFTGWSNRFLLRVLPVTILADAPRRNSVIVFSDVVGYTGLSARNEREALVLVAAFHRSARIAAENRRGRMVKTIGDAVLLEFAGADDAIACAQTLEAELMKSAHILGLPTPQLRTGVNAGEVAQGRDGDLFGDAVNIAARLQTCALPREVILSDSAARLLKDRDAIEPAGARKLKNIPVSIDTFRLRSLEPALLPRSDRDDHK